MKYSASLCRCPLPCCLAQEVTRLSDWAEILHVPISAPTMRFPKIFVALPGFFLTRCPKKSLVEHQKFVTSRGTCRYLHLQNFSQIGPLVLKLFIKNYRAKLQGGGQLKTGRECIFKTKKAEVGKTTLAIRTKS